MWTLEPGTHIEIYVTLGVKTSRRHPDLELEEDMTRESGTHHCVTGVSKVQRLLTGVFTKDVRYPEDPQRTSERVGLH